MVVGLHCQILLREVVKMIDGYRKIRADRFNYLSEESNKLLSSIATSIMLHEINQCDDVYSCVSDSGDGCNFQYGISRLTDRGFTVNIKIGANILPIRQSDRFVFSNGTLDIYSSYDKTEFVKIKVHKGLTSCKVTTSKGRSVSFDRERLLIKDLLGKYMSSANIPIDSDLYGGYKDYISMIEEMSVILGF